MFPDLIPNSLRVKVRSAYLGILFCIGNINAELSRVSTDEVVPVGSCANEQQHFVKRIQVTGVSPLFSSHTRPTSPWGIREV